MSSFIVPIASTSPKSATKRAQKRQREQTAVYCAGHNRKRLRIASGRAANSFHILGVKFESANGDEQRGMTKEFKKFILMQALNICFVFYKNKLQVLFKLFLLNPIGLQLGNLEFETLHCA